MCDLWWDYIRKRWHTRSIKYILTISQNDTLKVKWIGKGDKKRIQLSQNDMWAITNDAAIKRPPEAATTRRLPYSLQSTAPPLPYRTSTVELASKSADCWGGDVPQGFARDRSFCNDLRHLFKNLFFLLAHVQPETIYYYSSSAPNPFIRRFPLENLLQTRFIKLYLWPRWNIRYLSTNIKFR